MQGQEEIGARNLLCIYLSIMLCIMYRNLHLSQWRNQHFEKKQSIPVPFHSFFSPIILHLVIF